MANPDMSRVPRESLRISSVEPPGWEPTSGRLPDVGEQVYCTEGLARVVRRLGRTSDGSRLLELRCGERAQPYFVSSSNVLVRTAPTGPSPFLDEADAIGGR